MEKTKYSGKFIKVTEEVIENNVWERAYLPNSLMILPINENGQILIIKEYRPHENPPTRFKFVTGHIDGDEDVLKTANRELQEEVGYKAQDLEIILKVNSSGTINSEFYCVSAKNLSISKIPNPDGEESIISSHWYKPLELLEMIESCQIPWSLSSLGLFAYLRKTKDLLHN